MKDTVCGKILSRASYRVGEELNERWKGIEPWQSAKNVAKQRHLVITGAFH
jgi:hypothetical protein